MNQNLSAAAKRKNNGYIRIRNARLILPDGISYGSVTVKDGRIEAVESGNLENGGGRETPPSAYVETVDAKGLYLSPGFIDIHTHGAGGYDFLDGTEEAVYGACRMHLAHGTTCIVPTTLAGSYESLLAFLSFFHRIKLKKEGLPEILGLHLEGPYFSFRQKGAQNPMWLRNPDPKEYRAVLEASDRIRRWSFAVELPGAKAFLKELQMAGIISSLAHSDADCEQVLEAYKEGLDVITHFYSCMNGVIRRNGYRVAGAVEAGYLAEGLYLEAIADGCHLPAALLSLMYKIKGPDRICLVTDSMRAAGMPDGEYLLGSGDEGTVCFKENGVAWLPGRDAFAGSTATADRLVRTFCRLTGVHLYEVVKMMSLTPARLMGVDARKGSIEVGKDADLLLFDEDICVKHVMVRGNWIK